MKLNRRIGTWVSWLAVLSLAVVFAGCSQQTSSSKKSSKAQKIVLYSNSLSAGRGEWLKKEAAKAGFTITPVNKQAASAINPKEKALLKDIKTINIDKQWFNKNINKWIQKISLNYFD
ncbi:hypothetical protein [Lactiplantibacillus plantarum]